MDELYVLARRVLLDALEALGSHREAMVLVGAQAIYRRVGEADLAVAPYTTDADLAIDPAVLAKAPPIEVALGQAGFTPKTEDSVGIWVTHRRTSLSDSTEVAVDLLVPATVSPGRGRRAAKLAGHGGRAARIVRGLEGALVDAEVLPIEALEAADERQLEVRVAGPAALLVAKLFKIAERVNTARQEDKDALDVLRLLRGVTTEELTLRMRQLSRSERSAAVSVEAVEHLRTLFASRVAPGARMAVRATGGLVDPDETALSCELLARDLLNALGARPQ